MSETAGPAEALGFLEAQYRLFCENAPKDEKPRGGLGGFWDRLMRGPAAEEEPCCTAFLQSVGEAVSALAEALKDADAARRDECALAAAKFMLAPKPIENKTPAEWYMVAAEFGYAALIPFASKEALQKIRDDYARSYPRRMTYPRQRELLKRMDAALRGCESSRPLG